MACSLTALEFQSAVTLDASLVVQRAEMTSGWRSSRAQLRQLGEEGV